MRKSLSILSGMILLSTAVAAQVTVSQGPISAPPQAKEICPLQFDLDLSTQALHKSFLDVPEGATVSVSTGQYVCDKACVTSISFTKLKQRTREVQLVASVNLATGWIRQDVNLTIQFLVNGVVKRKEEWRSLTIGTTEGAAAWIPLGGSSPKARELKWWAKKGELDDWFADSAKPSVRVSLEFVP
jgi:hypothetical protein